ncbi:PepSY-like domain-containing protein [Brachyspira hyodysenteriae]|uniref:PepSY-like domain-containing protein n=1 Tax=Brachyspira hyodysenteriae TaxID=159 RepID=UPI0022CD8298|nr:PepSY-like domain-containing protein [Brachyspira hyodysenteriae]MCZ9885518.1 PepSY-like domain-containing protein [Brachyspira hyodysenteriae]MCZ9937994.1 PepSY-like domain-containing protein [Brachyspira hyodysenteriae]MDA0053613.1 PepSY-like domain-containing protein [Brachyspira hyodysenteriae]MDA0079596.1 PepSY-like domain-containing protein [Brachyspira hyodysenteriae]
MKKLSIFLASLFILSASSLFADMVVPPSALPQQANAFIQRAFPGAQIWKVERDGRKFDVQLSNGVSIDFLGNGDWENIDSEYAPIPDAAFPPAVIQAVKNAYPQVAVIDAEKEWGNYKLKLNNMMELMVTGNGQIMRQKFDD